MIVIPREASRGSSSAAARSRCPGRSAPANTTSRIRRSTFAFLIFGNFVCAMLEKQFDPQSINYRHEFEVVFDAPVFPIEP